MSPRSAAAFARELRFAEVARARQEQRLPLAHLARERCEAALESPRLRAGGRHLLEPLAVALDAACCSTQDLPPKEFLKIMAAIEHAAPSLRLRVICTVCGVVKDEGEPGAETSHGLCERASCKAAFTGTAAVPA